MVDDDETPRVFVGEMFLASRSSNDWKRFFTSFSLEGVAAVVRAL